MLSQTLKSTPESKRYFFFHTDYFLQLALPLWSAAGSKGDSHSSEAFKVFAMFSFIFKPRCALAASSFYLSRTLVRPLSSA